MSILVVGSVAFDSIQSPSGKAERVLGGAATYFSLAASYFTQVRTIAVVGDDFTQKEEDVLTRRGVDTSGIERVRGGKTFFWAGSYASENLNEAKTLVTDLNVFQGFDPKIPDSYDATEFLFLANIDPVLQANVRRKMPHVKLVGGDTMNYWINDHRAALLETLKGIDILLINDTEAKSLSGDKSLPRAAAKVLKLGPRTLVVKHGEYGATVFFSDGSHPFRAPALPIEEVVDPTGAGDSFAGGFMGYLASQGKVNHANLKRAMFYGGVMGSFAVERFGTERLQNLTREQIDERFQLFRQLTHLD
ncbi:MAG: sugar kinase [Acidobacteriales bacterium]|nr:sugar kinase [Terriglobales bacterium]